MKKIKVLLLVVICCIQTLQAQNASDLSVLLAESQMQRENPMTKWKYYYGFYMYSLFKVYERTQNPEYLEFIKTWADESMNAFAKGGKSFKTLDDMYPALVLLHLYESTGEEKYLDVAKKVVDTLKDYPRTKEGGFLHMVRHDGQLWLDGIYMINVFLAKYGEITGDTSFYDEVTKQISVYTDLLRDEKTGLLYHAYVEGSAPQFFDQETKHSSEFWGRSMGWVMMAAVEVLDIMPEDYKGRKEILKRLKSLSDALIKFQDAKSGLWYQVTNRGDLGRNWLESSSSAMFIYGLAKAANLDVLDKSYMTAALKGYKGMVKHKIFRDEEGLYTVKDICHGTVVGDLDYYLNRPPSDNNLRGLPAVILMSEELKDQPITMNNISEEDRKRREIEKSSAKESRYNVLDFGVKPDGRTINTHKIQILIELLHKNGGGTIYFPSGNYLSGSLILNDRVYLELSHGATLTGSPNMNDYPNKMPLISAIGSRNLGIIGKGTINGNGTSFLKNKQKPSNLPQQLIEFKNCRNIKINDISLTNAPHRNLNLFNCDYVWIDEVSMISDVDVPYSAGIDPASSSHVFITNCYFDLSDNVICPKSVAGKPTEYLVVDNCIIKSDGSAVKLDADIDTSIRHMVFNNIIIKNSQYGITLFAKNGGKLEDIRFSNIIIESSWNENLKDDRTQGSYPIFMDIEKRKPESKLGTIKNIHFSNITINSHEGHCVFLGQPESHIDNITFSNIQYNIKKHVSFEGYNKPWENRSYTGKVENDYSHIPANFTFAYANNILFNGITINDFDKNSAIEKHMIWGYEVNALQLKGYTFKQVKPNEKFAQIVFINATDVQLSAGKPAATSSPLLRLEGKSTKNVVLMNNNLSGISNILESGDGFKKSEFIDFNNHK